jgi:thymidylate kinase
MKLVCITGIDGTGKSTLARNTVAELQRQGYPAAYIYGRTYPVISRALMALGRLTMLRGKDQWRDYRAYSASKKRRMRSPLLAAIYTMAILVDYYVQIWLKLLPHLFSGRVVIADRYLYDTVISDLAVHLSYSVEQTAQAIEQGLKLLPMPVLTVLLDAREEVAFARKDDVPHIDYLRERRDQYLMLMARYEVKAFNGEAAPEALVQALASEIKMYESNAAFAASANNANEPE